MNTRIAELEAAAKQYTMGEVMYLERIHNRYYTADEINEVFTAKFAELIIQDCVEVLRLVPYSSDVVEFDEEIPFQEAIKRHFGVE